MKPESRPLPDPQREDEAEAGRFSLLILLDSRDPTLSSLEYAFSLAAAHRWDMHLLQLVDLNDFPEHANSPSVDLLLNCEYRRRANRLEAFREIIMSTGVTVAVTDTILLSSRQLDSLRKSVLQIAPDLVVIGRGIFGRKLLDEFVLKSCCPVLIVPETCRKTVSSSILLYSGNRRRPEHELFPLLRFAGIAQLSVSLVTVLNKKGLGTRTFSSYLPTSTCAAPVTYYQIEGEHSPVAVEAFLRKRSFGITSVILRKHWRFWRWFSRWSYLDLAYKISTPLLVFKVN